LLLVKDETTRGTIEWTLRGTGGFDLVQCDSAADAIRRLRRDELQPDYVLLDWHMPGAGEILRHFVSQPRYVRSRVIVMSDQSTDVPQLCVTAVVPRSSTGTEILATLDKIDPRGRTDTLS
jgi:CheY-like chemotaxis protein